MAFLHRSGIRLHWRVDGDKGLPPIFLLNSIGTDMQVWDEALPDLLGRNSVVRMDARGHGKSEASGEEYSLSVLAEDALAVLDAAGLASAAICGLSLGGMIAMRLALKAPARISSLVLVCTSAQMDAAVWQERIDRIKQGGMGSICDIAMSRFFSSDFVHARPEVAAKIRAGFLETNPAGYAGCCAAIRDMSLLPDLSAIEIPTLVITGAKDVSTPYGSHGEKIFTAIRNAHVATLDAAHLAPVEAPHAFSEALARFFSDIRSGIHPD